MNGANAKDNNLGLENSVVGFFIIDEILEMELKMDYIWSLSPTLFFYNNLPDRCKPLLTNVHSVKVERPSSRISQTLRNSAG